MSEVLAEAAPTGATMRRHRSPQGYGTPWSLIRACEVFFRRRIVWDLAANAGNAKAAQFISREENSLLSNWAGLPRGRSDVLWLNPPFDDIEPWARKCQEEGRKGTPILFLTPASVGANWFREHVYGTASVYFLNGRITFDGQSEPANWKAKHPGETWKPQGYPKDCMVSAFGCGIGPGISIWQWMKDVPEVGA